MHPWKFHEQLSSEILKSGAKNACIRERTYLKISSAKAGDRVNEVHEVINCIYNNEFLENEQNLFSVDWKMPVLSEEVQTIIESLILAQDERWRRA